MSDPFRDVPFCEYPAHLERLKNYYTRKQGSLMYYAAEQVKELYGESLPVVVSTDIQEYLDVFYDLECWVEYNKCDEDGVEWVEWRNVHCDNPYIKHRGHDRPAVMSSDGVQVWYTHGTIHRDGDKPAMIIRGTVQYLKHGRLHRESGPAVINEYGVKWWYLNGFCLPPPDGKDSFFTTHPLSETDT